ncbi:MAG: hypothetical protein ACE5JU_17135 [Candidatus Binatia bacterium]
MQRDPDGRLLVVTESSFLINFLAIDRMDILGGLGQFKFHVVDHVTAEIRYPDQQARLRAALAAGIVSEFEITDPVEILLYDELRKVLGDGESASLAVAVSRRWIIAADEKGRFRKELFERIGEDYLLDTPGALLAAIKSRVISISEAEELREALRRHRFEMKGGKGDRLLFNFIPGPPRALTVLCRPRRLAISSCHHEAPNGRWRLTHSRSTVNS